MILLLPLLFIGVCSALSPTTYLTPSDKEHLKQILDPAWALTDLSQILYAAGGYKHLGLEVPNKQNVCNFVKNSIKEKPSLETLYFASSAGKALLCPVTAPSNARQTLTEVLRDGTSPQELFYAISSLTNLGLDFDSAKALRAVQQALKKDDNVLSLGYAFHICSHLKGDTSTIFERIEDAIVQADEVDGQMLQFEGGLSITALVLSGAYKLAEVSKKAIPIKEEQIIKFSNYLMSRKSVQMAKGVYYLLEAVTMLTNNKFHVPVAITLASSVAVSVDSPKIQEALKLTAISATDEKDGKSIVTNKPLTKVANEKSLYELDVMSAKPTRGFYTLILNAEGGSGGRLVGNTGASLTFKVLSAVALQDVEIGTADSDQSTSPSLNKVIYPKKLHNDLEADQHQRVLLRFVVKDSTSGKPTRVHQAFVRVTHQETYREIIFVAEADSNDVYKFDMDVTGKRKEFGGMNGKYTLDIIIGDASISNPLMWHLADIVLTFPEGSTKSEVQDFTYKVKPRPEIQHLFRSPDPKPPKIVALAFTILCLSPLLVLFVGWAKLGVNLSNFQCSLSACGFHVGLGGIFALFFFFWLELNMFTTLRKQK
ncbi:Dolichyl-diphosphooligosaccharide--protein glycosyltransferase subunit 2 [Armadillidium nasatum]|uniref:Dolichyl-diphosphooligosaccharide--protein glycosyltransferase subunit 2 n=1 Tax=Armadillidium nasatum TaxID=96803 RepID=A0A5N5T962_9CRUS|nr:Dolichyl-diphosphooligosaccharide--protein glycosyltransferase subunit 2 [Armadillidium nasatum]